MLTLSGWAQPSDAVARAIAPEAAWFDYSAYPNAAASFEALHTFREHEHVIGWSMGGQLALRAIAAGVLRPRKLTLIAAPYQFVRTPSLAQAMDTLTFTTFRENYVTDPERTAGRFHALVAKGDARFREVMSGLSHHAQVLDTGRWLPWLDDLGATSLAGLDLTAVPETSIIHGTHDAIVPIAQAQLLADAIPSARIERWEGVAHAPHLHDATRLRELLA